MDKQEFTLEEVREELEKWNEILESWAKLTSTEKFSHYYQVSKFSVPFIDKSLEFRDNPHLTSREMEWNTVIVDLAYFRRNLEKLWKAKSEDDMEEAIEKAKAMLIKLLEEYDNYMAGE